MPNLVDSRGKWPAHAAMRLSACLLVITVLAPAASAAAQAPGVQGIFSADDYPDEALRLGQQGTVGMRVTVGPDGLVQDCLVLVSSNSPSLDIRSCEIMRTRARFTPATDSSGRPTTGTFDQRITWRIQLDDPAMRQRLMREQWRGCVHAQALKLAAETGSAEALADRAVNACRVPERSFRLALREGFTVVDVPATVRGFRKQYRTSAVGVIQAARTSR